MANQSKSILAKLLANENISIQYGNFPTAFFDVEKRVLGLPLWKSSSRFLTDLLIGHEVGHALYTPKDGWHDSSIEIPGCPRSYVNVVEDVRIEKKIQSKYPGLTRSFKLGYKELFARNFFGTKNRDIESYSLVDRINIKAKLRDIIDVPFSKEEQPLVNKVMSVETWDDVLDACRDLYAYMQEHKDNNNDNFEDNSSQMQSPNSGNENEDLSMESQSSNSESREEAEDENLENSIENSSEISNESDQVKDTEGGSSFVESSKKVDIGDVENVETDASFRENEEDLLEKDDAGKQPLYVRSISKNQYKEMLFTYSDVEQARKLKISDHPVIVWEDYKAFLDETNKTTGLMAKEFEMRKAAYRTQRAQTARTGSIDTNKLHSYKYNDDIFAKVTNLADAKSHGMIMLIDYSGSMDRILGDTIKQTLNLAMFCKKVNIPFVIYGFTSGNPCGREYSTISIGEVDHKDTRIFELLNSSMKKTAYEEAYRMLYLYTLEDTYHWNHLSDIEGFGGTPLNEVIMASDHIVKDFRNKFPVQKVNLVLLTDGDGRNVRVNHEWSTSYSKDMIIEINGKLDKVSRNSRLCTEFLLNKLRKQGITTIGYRLAERNYDFNGALYAASDKYLDYDVMKDFRKTYNKQKFLSMDNKIGYDRYFVIKADRKSLNTDVEELEIDADFSKAQITKAFKKHAGSKKGNRILATKFAEIVA
jgi:hypothetical protein